MRRNNMADELIKKDSLGEGYRHVEKKDNLFGIEIHESDEVTIAINGNIVVSALVPYSGHLNCYLKRDSSPLLYK